MAVYLKIEVLGQVKLLHLLDGIEQRAEDFRPVWDEVARDLMDFEKRVFASEGAAIRHVWPSLSPDYLAQKMREGYPASILVRTGALKRSLTEEGSADMILIKEPKFLRFGTATKVGRWFLGPIHQDPQTANVPARPMVPTDPSMIPAGRIRKWIQWMEDHLLPEGEGD